MAGQVPWTDSPSSPVRGCGQRGKCGDQRMRSEDFYSDAYRWNTML